ncbi:hypothetical protein HG530_004041 [Fusarium avenaceum]|nr:hypothetical protein HG530_004041 [Fusarium avenaceum]
MYITTTFVQTVAGLITLARCGSAKFTLPPELESGLPENRDMGKNVRYDSGDKIVIAWETVIPVTTVAIGGNFKSRVWAAEYNLLGLAMNNEDSVYWFMLDTSEMGKIAGSVPINVTAPQDDKIKFVSVSTTLTSRQQEPSSTTETDTGHTTTGSSSTEETSSSSDPGSDSGLSRGETAGVTAGAIIGGLLILGGLGWFAWRKLAMGKEVDKGLQHQQEQFYSSETKAELPGNLDTHPSDYARSPAGLYEAP